MTYNQPVRFLYKGDRKIALSHVRDARVLVWKTKQELGRSNGRRIYPLKDGTMIDIIIAGMQVTVSIIAPGGKKKARWFEDFVIFNGDTAVVDDQLVYYPIIMSPDQNEDEPGWRTYFRSAAAPGYENAPEPKGGYVSVFPRTETGGFEGDMFLGGGGGAVHVNTEGEACTWTQAGQYWAPPYRTPWSIASTLVYHQGRVLLNTIDHLEDGTSDYYVMGAGIHDGYLYTVQAALYFNMPYTASPASPTHAFDVWASPQYYGGSVFVSLRRYRIYPVRDTNSGAMFYRIANGSEEVLWRNTISRGLNYWRFNEDCTQAVSFNLPEQALQVYDFNAAPTVTPSTSVARLVLDIDQEEPSATISVFSAGNIVAEDNGKTLLLDGAGASWDFIHEKWTVPAIRYAANSYQMACPFWLDVRNGYGVFIETSYTVTPVPGDPYSIGTMNFSSTMNFYKPDGTVETLATVTPTTISTPGYIDDALRRGLDDLMAANPCGMTLMYYRAIGWLAIEASGVGVGIGNVYTAWMPNEMLRYAYTPNGTAFGGFKIRTSGAAPGWDYVVGYRTTNNPDPYPSITQPTAFAVLSAGAGTEHNAVFGGSMSPLPVNYPSNNPAYSLNHITHGDLTQLTGGAFDNVLGKLILTASILGKPPLAQTLEY